MALFGTGSAYEEIVTKNRYGIRTLEANYLQKEYEKMQNAKKAERFSQKLQKDMQHDMLNKLNDSYMDQLASNRKRKARQMKALSNQYDEFIKSHQHKDKIDQLINKNIQKSTLAAPTWIRDVFTERDAYKKNMDYYNKSLADHVKLQNLRKDVQREEEMYRQKKIQQQADLILKKQIQEMQARHQQRTNFEKRQNQLLGVKNQVSQQFGPSGILPRDTIHRLREQDLYSKGLEVQFKKEQQKRYSSQEKMSNNINHNIYNPITNPLPFVYKNPNVLRTMMTIN